VPRGEIPSAGCPPAGSIFRGRPTVVVVYSIGARPIIVANLNAEGSRFAPTSRSRMQRLPLDSHRDCRFAVQPNGLVILDEEKVVAKFDHKHASQCAVTADGKTVATGSGDGTVKLWDVSKATGRSREPVIARPLAPSPLLP